MDKLQVFLFGKFRIKYAEQEIEKLPPAKAQELLSYLLLNRDRPHYREAVATVLWDNKPTVQSKQYLRRALWQIQSTFSAWQVSPDKTIVLAEGDWIQFNLQARIWVDAIYFEQSCTPSKGVLGQYLNAEDVRRLREATQLYRSSLLEGCYQDWCLFEREKFRQMFLGTLDKLMLYCEINGEYETGIEYGRCILRYDQAREHTHRRLMRLYCLSGKRTDALHQYKQCTSILGKELGIKPTRTTSELFEKICEAQFELPLPMAPGSGSLVPQERRLLQKVRGELKEIRSVLTGIHEQLQRQIEVVESALDELN
jgi:DNA-binding SARP family transcriptional activator